MLRFGHTSWVQAMLLGLGALFASCGPSPTDPPSLTPPPPTFTPSPDGIALYSANDCKESNVGVTDGAHGQLIQFTTNDRFQNDEARSLLFRRLKPGTIIHLYDDPAGTTGDDWVEILVKQEVEGYCIVSLENSFEDVVIRVSYSQMNGLDGKVSLMKVDQVADEPTQIVGTATPEATATNTATPTHTSTPLPPIPSIPESECVPRDSQRELATVSNVVDGDTIDVLIGQEAFRLRYIGMDTPDAGDPFVNESSAVNTELVLGKTVTLVKDVSETDQFGRLLRYVFADDEFVNYELVVRGYAQAATYPPDVACSTIFFGAQNLAELRGDGLWNATATPIPTSTSFPTQPPPGPTSPPSGNCHPSYPTVCIPPPPPDLDCGEISFRRFTVVGSDPHRFDGDDDGIGCESG